MLLRRWYLLFVLAGSLCLVGQTPPTTVEREALDRGIALMRQNEVAAAGAVLDSLAYGPEGELRGDSFGVAIQYALGRNYTNYGTEHEAVPYYETALELADALYAEPHNDRARIRVGLSEALITADRPRAIRLIGEARDIYRALPDPDAQFWVRALWNLARAYELDRDLAGAENAIALAVAKAENEPAVPVSDRFLILNQATQIGLEFHDGGGPTQDYAEAALVAARAYGDPMYVHTAYATLMSLHNKLNQPARVRSYARQNLAFLEARPGLEFLQADVYVTLTNSYRKVGDYGEALLSANRAVDLQRAYDPTYLHYGLAARANTRTQSGDPAAAVADLNEALTVLGGGADTVGSLVYLPADSVRQVGLAINVYDLRAQALRRAGRPTDALADLAAITTLGERQRRGVSLTESRLYLSGKLSDFYARSVDLHQQLARTDPVHYWNALLQSDRAKGFSLLARLTERRAARDAQRTELRAELAALEQVSDPTPEQTDRLATARLDLARLDRALKETIPEVTEYGLPELQTQLAAYPEEVLVYHFGTDSSYLFRVTPGNTPRTYLLPPADSLAPLITAWRKAIRASAYRVTSLRPLAEQLAADERFLTLGQALRRAILPGIDPAKLSEQLLIVPDGPLNYLPFGALPLSSGDLPLDYGKLEYLQNDRTLRYAYSLRYLAESARLPASDAPYDLVAFAPSFTGDTSVLAVRSAVATPGADAPALSPLRHNVPEVERIAGGIGNHRTYLGSDASIAAFREAAGSGRVLHVSTHGLVDAADPRLSFLAFSAGPGQEVRQSLLFVNELPSLNLNADLVVLSACETSLGEVAPGENVLSLGSAFAASGARSTLTTLWAVDDRAIEEQMVGFYANLQTGMSRTRALAAAKENQRRGEYAHPYYWSATLLHGAGGPLELGTPGIAWWVYLVGAAVLLLPGYALLRRLRA